MYLTVSSRNLNGHGGGGGLAFREIEALPQFATRSGIFVSMFILSRISSDSVFSSVYY